MNAGRGRAALQRVAARPLAVCLTAVVSAAVVLGPALAPGFVLVGDMVFVPRMPLTPALVGLSSAAPRAVPSDALVALLSTVVPGELVQKLVLLALLVGAATGAGLLLPLRPLAASAVAVAYVWNPFVAERLGMGQWAVMVGYAALPWVVRACWRWGAGDRSAWRAVAVSCTVGALGGAPGWLVVLLGGVTAYLVGARSTGRRLGPLATLGGLLAALALPWAVPALVRPVPVTGDPAGAAVFAPQADTPWGPFFSVLTGGGIWNVDVVPPGRDTVVGALAAAVVLALGVAGLVLVRRHLAPGTTALAAVVAVGAVGLVLVLLTMVPSVAQGVASLPGGGLLRDGSRQVAAWVLMLSVGLGCLVEVLLRAAPSRRALPVLLSLVPVAALPALGWGVSGRLAPVSYPRDFAAAARLVGSGGGAVVVLPFETYRRYPWNDGRSSLDPLPRWFAPVTVASSDLVVRRPGRGVTRVAGEDPLADRVSTALQGPQPTADLARLGIRWLVVDHAGSAPPPGVIPRLDGPALRVYEVPGVEPGAARDADRSWRPPPQPVVLGDLLAVLVAGGAIAAGRGRKSRSPARPVDTVQ